MVAITCRSHLCSVCCYDFLESEQHEGFYLSKHVFIYTCVHIHIQSSKWKGGEKGKYFLWNSLEAQPSSSPNTVHKIQSRAILHKFFSFNSLMFHILWHFKCFSFFTVFNIPPKSELKNFKTLIPKFVRITRSACLGCFSHFNAFVLFFFLLSPTLHQKFHTVRQDLPVFFGHFARRMLLAFPDSQDSQCFLFHRHLIPGRAFLHSSSSLNASQFGGLYTRMSFKRTLENPPNMYIDLLRKSKQIQHTVTKKFFFFSCLDTQ